LASSQLATSHKSASKTRDKTEKEQKEQTKQKEKEANNFDAQPTLVPADPNSSPLAWLLAGRQPLQQHQLLLHLPEHLLLLLLLHLAAGWAATVGV
jgi:hypothetical protein